MLFIDIGILALGVYLQFRIIPLIKNGLTGMYGKEIAIGHILHKPLHCCRDNYRRSCWV